MWLDADDMIEDKDREKFLGLKETLSPDTDMVMMPYYTAFDQRGEPVFVFYRERLLRRKAGFRWQGFLHEAITPSGKIGYSDAAVSHRKLHVKDPERNLRIYEAHLAKGTPFSPRDRFYYGRELADRGQYEKAERVLQDFLDSGRGWVENCREACRYLYQCRKELGKKHFVNSAYLGQLFHKKYNQSFKDYLNNVRIEKATLLLIHTDKKIYEIADSVGYRDLDYFINRFISMKGCTPARFRKQNRS